MSGETSLILRSESSLVFWQDGMALFRVRLSRSDGAIAEGHGAAHDGEAEQFWTLAEDRARERAQELLDSMPPVQPGRVLPPKAGTNPLPNVGAAAGTGRPSAPAARAPAGPGRASPAPPPAEAVPASSGSSILTAAPGSSRQEEPAAASEMAGDSDAGITAESSGSGSPRDVSAIPAGTVTTPGSNSLAEDDPFSDEVHFTDEPEPEPPPTSRPSSSPTITPETRQPGHIRPETGGAARQAVSARSTGTPTTPAPGELPQCTAPSCTVILTKGQVTMSTHKYGQALCAKHMRERG